MYTICDSGIISHDKARGAYMPSVTLLRSGRWVACQHVGQELASPDNSIEVLTSSDGKNWSAVARLGVEDDGYAYRGPDICEAADGTLLLSATRFESSDQALFDPDSEGLQRPELILYRSRDQGTTWSGPEIVPVDLPPERYTWNKAGGIMLLAEDRWMLPFETWKPTGCTAPPDQKAAAIFSADQGRSWGELTIVADDPSGRLLYWDQLNSRMPDGRIYTMLWTHIYNTDQDDCVHWVCSEDDGRTWSQPQPTNLRGQVCCPISLADGRMAAIYNHRHEPHSVRIAISEDLSTFDLYNQLTVFDAGSEATFGTTDHENFLAEHMLIAFGKPQGQQLPNGDLLVYFWCTVGGVTHTRWVRCA
jgi:hypothetical protein